MSYIICFWDKSKVQVSDILAVKLMNGIEAGDIKNFILNESLYAVGGVEKIIPKEEARQSFPADWEYFNTMDDAKSSQDFQKLGNDKLLNSN